MRNMKTVFFRFTCLQRQLLVNNGISTASRRSILFSLNPTCIYVFSLFSPISHSCLFGFAVQFYYEHRNQNLTGQDVTVHDSR